MFEAGESINLPSQSPAIYLFSSQPSIADALAGTGSVRTKTYWIESNSKPYRRTYTIDPINDPAPTSGSGAKTIGYWESINYVRSAGGQTQTLLRYFEVERTPSTDSHPETTVEDLKAVMPSIGKYCSDGQLSDNLETALTLLKLHIKSRGLEFTKYSRLDELTLALAYKTISIANRGLIQTPDDKHNYLYNEFESLYAKAMNQILLPYDSDGDGQPDTVKQPESSVITMIR